MDVPTPSCKFAMLAVHIHVVAMLVAPIVAILVAGMVAMLVADMVRPCT